MKRVVTTDDTSVSTQSNNLSFEIPTEFVPLPSKGLVYGSDSNLCNLEEVEMRVMTARDEDILTSQSLIRKGVVIERLLQNVLVDKTININDMIRGDRDALLIALRITGYGTEYQATIGCPVCDEKFDETFDLAKLEIKYLELPPIREHSNEFSFNLPVTERQVVWRFLTGADENEIVETQKRSKAKLNTGSDSFVTLRLIHSIISVDGITDKSQIANFVRNMPAKDSLELRSHMDNNEPKIDMGSFIDCPTCGSTSEVAIPMAVQFFWPNART